MFFLNPHRFGVDFFCKKNLNRVAERAPTEQGGKGGKDAAGRERRRLERAGRRPANERPVQVRELALFFFVNPHRFGVDFFLQCVRLWRHAAGGHRNGVCLANVVRRLSVAECRNNRSGVFLIRKHQKTPKFKMLSTTNLIFFV